MDEFSLTPSYPTAHKKAKAAPSPTIEAVLAPPKEVHHDPAQPSVETGKPSYPTSTPRDNHKKAERYASGIDDAGSSDWANCASEAIQKKTHDRMFAIGQALSADDNKSKPLTKASREGLEEEFAALQAKKDNYQVMARQEQPSAPASTHASPHSTTEAPATNGSHRPAKVEMTRDQEEQKGDLNRAGNKAVSDLEGYLKPKNNALVGSNGKTRSSEYQSASNEIKAAQSHLENSIMNGFNPAEALARYEKAVSHAETLTGTNYR